MCNTAPSCDKVQAVSDIQVLVEMIFKCLTQVSIHCCFVFLVFPIRTFKKKAWYDLFQLRLSFITDFEESIIYT